ncbi:adenylate cyclase class 2 [Allocatelliglobosispora scoriae]|uniref:Adenylate cyclase class 2 n=1 Tax=Allocatelliglobosispora scoriae TaxID=643052 RepID=A0A841BHQ4_9ACTN|nr:CYTH domain-containing protein [Allocatelliglobosispora scoriae]MBB5866706.1 adenylate cyclase class 2 [Allocatelliglobosispora scoriae]
MLADALRSREVEVKYQVDGGDPAAAAERALAKQGVSLGSAVAQDDQAYAPAAWSYGQSKIGVAFARLRTEAGRVLFTVKTPLVNELDCAEQETVVADRAAMHEALLLMGYVPTVRIVKYRRTGSWSGGQVCLDVVEGLGVFVEVERLVSADASSLAVQAELDVWVQDLGVPVRRVTQTYDSLLRAVV